MYYYSRMIIHHQIFQGLHNTHIMKETFSSVDVPGEKAMHDGCTLKLPFDDLIVKKH